ncbi:radical SAM protein [Emcibacter sp.]|uniref:radical SAM protein n=1 Tax=Emcibacter sp. TaxID=1979954 RepID=UPI002AA6D991|nr:radical SAM protein [Emcibacter sp.]
MDVVAGLKFRDPHRTAAGDERARVDLVELETLWFNTGSLCNLECRNCYIESSPTNDRLAYISRAEVANYLAEIRREGLPVREIGLTGGEPFMNPDIIGILEDCLAGGFEVLVLTNAMKPLHHKKSGLLDLRKQYGATLKLRVSVDHYCLETHETERGGQSWAPMIEGLTWLAQNGFHISIAGRTFAADGEEDLRRGYQTLFDDLSLGLDAFDPVQLVLFPEMDDKAEVPEITTACWDILGVSPDAMMCSNSRMIVKHRGEAGLSIMPCTLLPYDRRFDMGQSLKDMGKTVSLNHPHCAKFCVLGGASCSG